MPGCDRACKGFKTVRMASPAQINEQFTLESGIKTVDSNRWHFQQRRCCSSIANSTVAHKQNVSTPSDAENNTQISPRHCAPALSQYTTTSPTCTISYSLACACLGMRQVAGTTGQSQTLACSHDIIDFEGLVMGDDKCASRLKRSPL